MRASIFVSRWLVAAACVFTAAAVTPTALASPTEPAPRDGFCDDGEFCYYYNSDAKGSISDFKVESLGNYGTTLPSCYDFKGGGNGKGQCIKNNAASVWNRTNHSVTVYSNSNYVGAHQDIDAGFKGNLNSALKNNNASHQPANNSTECDTAGWGDHTGPAGPTTGNANAKVARVIAAAKHWAGRGITYSWGGGGRSGPTCSDIKGHTPDDYGIYGFDCSGFVQHAFWAGAGVNIGGTSSVQSLKGSRIPYNQARAGDLIFWGSPGNTTHVALLIGNGQLIESSAPRSTTSVHIAKIYGQHTFAVRIF
jgi:cell wall-associated NlpC family hydrolase